MAKKKKVHACTWACTHQYADACEWNGLESGEIHRKGGLVGVSLSQEAPSPTTTTTSPLSHHRFTTSTSPPHHHHHQPPPTTSPPSSTTTSTTHSPPSPTTTSAPPKARCMEAPGLAHLASEYINGAATEPRRLSLSPVNLHLQCPPSPPPLFSSCFYFLFSFGGTGGP